MTDRLKASKARPERSEAAAPGYRNAGSRSAALGTPTTPAQRPEPLTWPDDRLTLSWLGHATVLLNFFGRRIVTDPVLENRIGIGRGLLKLGPRRLAPPALRARELPPLDLVLLSHAHMDHTDLGTLGALPRRTPVVVQPGNRDLVRRFRQVEELPWGQTVEMAGVEITSVEVRHWGARMIHDQQRGYGGYLLRRSGVTVLFAGDTAYTEAFARLGRSARVDLAILPIGAYDPWIANHASPEEAWRMFRALGATWVLPVHHSTFRLSREPLDEPVHRLLAAAGEERWRVLPTTLGATWSMPER
jgi:L-ascorbate metabolism protein UlaG (beta-lactamase superfamily)